MITDLQTALVLRLPKTVQGASSPGHVLYRHADDQRAGFSGGLCESSSL